MRAGGHEWEACRALCHGGGKGTEEDAVEEEQRNEETGHGYGDFRTYQLKYSSLQSKAL